MTTKEIERMKGRAKQRMERAKGAAKSAYVYLWVKVNTKLRDELPVLRGAPLSVLVYLALRMDKKYQCNPGVELIAKQTGYSIRRVQTALHYLRVQGYIHYQVQRWTHGKGRQPSNVYTLTRRWSIGEKSKGDIYPLFEYGQHTREAGKDEVDDSAQEDTRRIEQGWGKAKREAEAAEAAKSPPADDGKADYVGYS